MVSGLIYPARSASASHRGIRAWRALPAASGLEAAQLVQILHRLTGRPTYPRIAGLPHALRHFAATSWLRGGAGLDEVRRLLGHESLNTTLRYSNLVGADLQRAHKRAGAIERLRLG